MTDLSRIIRIWITIVRHVLINKYSAGWHSSWVFEDAKLGDIRPGEDLCKTVKLGFYGIDTFSQANGVFKFGIWGVDIVGFLYASQRELEETEAMPLTFLGLQEYNYLVRQKMTWYWYKDHYLFTSLIAFTTFCSSLFTLLSFKFMLSTGGMPDALGLVD